MSPGLTFVLGLVLMFLFGWYFLTDSERAKRILGSVLTVLLTFLCLTAIYPPEKKISLGLDLRGGTSFLIQLVSQKQEDGTDRPITPELVDQAVETIRKRVDSMGTSEPVITPAGQDRILVQIPGLDTAKLDQTREQLQKVAKLEFRFVHPNSDQILAGFMPPQADFVRAKEKITRNGETIEHELLVRNKPDLTGDRVARAGARYGDQGFEVLIDFNDVGKTEFGRLTQDNVGQRFAIMLDGEVISAPVIQTPILDGSARITGQFSEAEARNLASVLENPLATPVRIVEERSASASLGADSINSGLYAGGIGLALTVIAVLAYYRVAGVVANIALAINMVLLFGVMAMFGSVLTLPGIAGVILTLGMAIDANVLIYERLREEMAAGKSLKAALDAAYNKAFSAIFDSNLTTLITAIILFYYATGPVRGFAVTLTIGIVASMFTALLVTRNVFSWAIHLGWVKEIKMSSLIRPTKYNFLSWRKVASIASVLMILGSIGYFAIRGEKNFGVDFKGGDRLVLEATKEKPDIAQVRALIEKDLGISDPVVQIEKSPAKEFLSIRTPADTSERIQEALNQKFPNAGFVVEASEKVGSVVGSELAKNSLIALALGGFGIFIYVALRFEFSFALGTLYALVHDVVVTIGIFALLQREMSMVIIGAILTIAGYSVNDTIVVFDRIRERLQAGSKGSILEIMNQSINDTLSRTVLTGGVTLLTTAILFFFGGPVLADFALTILIGVVVGTYSSIFVAAPVVYWWSKRGGQSLQEEMRRAEEARTATA